MERLIVKKISIIIMILGLWCLSHAGLYFVEVPGTITDEMFFKGGPDIEKQLMTNVYNVLEGKKEEVAVVIFTRNGEPIRPTIMNEQINNNKETKLTKELSDENNITFYWKNDYDDWTEDQINDMLWFLYNVPSDDGYAQGIYNASKKLYGPPFFDSDVNNYTVELYFKK